MSPDSGAGSTRVPLGTDRRPASRDTALVAALAAYQDAVVRSANLDPALTEMVRLRCARQHNCRICQTLRLGEAITRSEEHTSELQSH